MAPAPEGRCHKCLCHTRFTASWKSPWNCRIKSRVSDSTRQFSLELISASGGAWLGDNVTCVVNILDTNTPPNFTGQPVILPNGNFQFQTLCSTGLIQTVQFSRNLIDWQTLQPFTNATAVTTITDTNGNGHGAGFYRVVVP